MPFTNGTYVPVTGETTAQAGDVIRSSAWNAIHTDIGACLTQLGQILLQGPRIITVSGTVNVTTTDSILIVQASAPIINIPTASSRTSSIKIMGGAAGIFSVNNSVITPMGGDKISGLATVTLNVDYQVITLFPLASGGYLID